MLPFSTCGGAGSPVTDPLLPDTDPLLPECGTGAATDPRLPPAPPATRGVTLGEARATLSMLPLLSLEAPLAGCWGALEEPGLEDRAVFFADDLPEPPPPAPFLSWDTLLGLRAVVEGETFLAAPPAGVLGFVAAAVGVVVSCLDFRAVVMGLPPPGVTAGGRRVAGRLPDSPTIPCGC